MTFIFNNSPLYTLLFKGGSLEIKPKSFYAAKDFELDLFGTAKMTGQVSFYSSIDEVPQESPAATTGTVIDKSPVQAGLTEEELKAELAEKEKNKPSTEPSVPGTVTNLGEPISEVLVTKGSQIESTPASAPASDSTESKPKKEPKAPRKARAEAIGEDSAGTTTS
jgi:hypothetical protein